MSDSPGPDWGPGEFINHIFNEIIKDVLKLHQLSQLKWLIFMNAFSRSLHYLWLRSKT